ncbi:MAG TPA: polysaccharide deacetylase family protein [Thermoanaerobaculia bacterium]|nr:polysaccharide deacetylase family protein [Thermoanaerobaculia bacterium]
MRGHLYCSTRCARDSVRLVFWGKLDERLRQPVSSRLSVILILLAVCTPTFAALRAVSELDRLNAPSRLAPPRHPPAARIESVETQSGGTRIAGSAPDGTAVFLFAGERFVGAAPAEAGRFQFEGVQQKGPYRVGAMPLSLEPHPFHAPADTASPPAVVSPVEPTRSDRMGTLIPDLVRGPLDRREILVSFDAGSSDRGAREILDALRQRHLRTTIFLTGDFIRRYPDLTRRIAADGHEVGNHTETHPHLTTYAADGRQTTRPGVDQGFVTGQLLRTARLYGETTGRAMAPLWRAPYGEQNAEIRHWAAQAGYWHVGWSGAAGLDGLDWVSDPRSHAYRSAQQVIERLVDHAENGGIVLLHLGSDREDPVAPKIPALLDGLAHRGFRLALASEFLAREGMTPGRLAALVSRGDAAVP